MRRPGWTKRPAGRGASEGGRGAGRDGPGEAGHLHCGRETRYWERTPGRGHPRPGGLAGHRLALEPAVPDQGTAGRRCPGGRLRRRPLIRLHLRDEVYGSTRLREFLEDCGQAYVLRLIRAAGLRWPVEESFELAKGCFGLDQCRAGSTPRSCGRWCWSWPPSRSAPPPGPIPLVPQTHKPGTQLRPCQLAIGDYRTMLMLAPGPKLTHLR
jgi:hypothetical protein